MRRRRHLVIMVKAPRLGRVKTRLGKEIGQVAAWRFYMQSAGQTIQRLGGDPRWTLWLQITPDHRGLFPKQWKKRQFLKQGSGNLGQRMMKPFKDLPPGPVVLIGSDIPAVRRHHIWGAFKVLGNNQVVFAPAQDGGFWMVGQRRRPRLIELFKNPVRWSSGHTLEDSLKGVKQGSVGFGATLSDVDDAKAYRAWQGQRNS